MNQQRIETTKVERAVQISLAITAALGTLLLGIGQQSLFLPSLAILGAVGSVVLTDTLGTFRLNRNLANLGALLAVFYTIIVMILGTLLDRQDNQAALIRVANLLVYLQIILQFQQKILRIYWSLSVLSLLQVVVASALNLSVSFGPLLAIYMCSALTSLSLLFIYRETIAFHDGQRETATPAAGPPRRWPLAGRNVRWSSPGGEDLAQPLLGRPIARHVVGMGIVTIIVTTLIFFGVPRRDRDTWRSESGSAASTTGFTEEVSLGRTGRIVQSDEEVLRVSYLDPEKFRPFRVNGETYLRGSTLNDYHAGDWTQGRSPSFNATDLSPDRSLSGRVIQDITLDIPLRPGIAGRHSVLFSAYPVYQHEPTYYDLQVDHDRNQLLVDNTSLPDKVPQLHYIVRSGAFRGRNLAKLTPETNSRNALTASRIELDDLAGLSQLRALAQQVVDQANADTPLEKVTAIESHFVFPGRYTYDLDPDVQRTPGMDPVEDFVVNHQSGHCEYFASAAVLMLRSQGIPARMVLGYKSGEWNSVGNYYQVRQLHAHAWVEAYLAPGEFNPSQLPDGAPRNGEVGAWLRLDPTPADFDADDILTEDSLLARAYDAVDYVQLLWDDYVLGLDSDRQKESIYQPLTDGWQRMKDFLHDERSRLWQWATYIGGTIALSAIAMGGIVFVRRRYGTAKHGGGDSQSVSAGKGWLTRWFGDGMTGRQAAQQPHVEFYRRMEKALRKKGIARLPGQTQREFAEAAGGELADASHLQSVAGVPRRVASAFYEVRFGGKALDSSQQQAVEQSLHDLEVALAAHPPHEHAKE